MLFQAVVIFFAYFDFFKFHVEGERSTAKNSTVDHLARVPGDVLNILYIMDIYILYVYSRYQSAQHKEIEENIF